MYRTVASALGAGLLLVFGVATLGVRAWFHRRRTGSWGIRLRHGSSVARLASGLIALSVVFGVAGCVIGPRGTWLPLAPLARIVLGLAITVFAVVGVFVAQGHMRESWRVGVDPDEVTALVTAGSFAFVRNPIFSGWIVVAVGIFVLVPNLVTLASVVVLVVGIELQIRRVEEPYLLRVHGEAYARYAADVGRLVPVVGKGV